jgi:sarcosine oxidase gamma subunit
MNMYAKVYRLGCNPDNAAKMLDHYDAVMTPAIQSSEFHAGHQMVEAGPDKWLLVSTYHNKAAAEAAASLVQELVKPMVEQFGLTLDVITEGEVVRSI